MNVRKTTKGKGKKKAVKKKPAPLVPEIVEAIPVTTLSNPPAVINVGVKKPVHKPTPEYVTVAFEKYVQMGDARSLRKLAEEMGMMDRTVMKWSSRYKWQDKIKSLTERAISSSVVEPITVQMVKRKSHLRLIDFMLRDAAILNEDGEIIGSKVELKSMQDVQRALETRDNIINPNQDKNKLFGPGAQIGKAVFIIRK